MFGELKLWGVPMVYRMHNKHHSGPPYFSSKDFGAGLDAYVAGAEGFEKYLKDTEGDEYKTPEERWVKQGATYEKVLASQKAKRAKAIAQQTPNSAVPKAEGGTLVVCEDGQCAVPT